MSRPGSRGSGRGLALITGAALLLLAASFPFPWPRLPPPPDLPPPPMSGSSTLRLVLAIDGLILLLLAFWSRGRSGEGSAEQPAPAAKTGPEWRDLERPGLWLSLLTAAALASRLPGVASDLWLDEIGTVLDCLETSAFEMWTTFRAAGRHLLNSLEIQAVLVFAPAAGRPPAWALSLPRYYRLPKQPTRQSLEWILERGQPGEPIVGIYLAKWGLRYYGPDLGIEEGRDFLAAHKVEDLPPVSAGAWVLTTFEAALAIEIPELWGHLESRYHPVRELPATVRGAEIRIWRPRLSTRATVQGEEGAP